MRALALRTFGACCALAFGAGCLEEATQVIVSVDAEPGLKADIDKLRIHVEGRDGIDSEEAVEKLDETLSGEIDWPVKLAFQPAEDDADRGFWLEVTASEGTTVLVVARLVTGYVEGETRYAELLLEDACRDVDCNDTGDTCHKGGCVPAVITPDALGESRDEAVGIGDVTDGGGLEPDAGSDPDMDAGPDASADAGQDGATDAGQDSGPPLECVETAECTEANEPICDTSEGVCRGCAADPECVTRDSELPHCVSGHCVQCVGAADCGSATPVCDEGTCRTCALNDECATGACAATGACEVVTNIVYLDPDNGVGGGCGTQESPCQSVYDATSLLNVTRNVLHIAPGTYQYLQLVFSTTTPVRVVGVGATLNLQNSSGGPGVDVSAGAVVTLEDLTIESAQDELVAPNAPGRGVNCVNSTLTLRRVTISNSDKQGVASSACALEVSDSLIEDNADYGITFSDGSGLVQRSIIRSNLRGGLSVYGPDPMRVLNNLIVGNSTISNYDGAIRGNGLGTDTVIAFNTITGNFVNQNYIGILGCVPDWVLDSNIVWGNTVGGGDAYSQTFLDCTVTNSITEAAAVAGGGPNGSTFTSVLTDDPLWVDPAMGNYELQAASPALDIGTVSNAGTLDEAGQPRTSGSGPDLGCYER